MSRNTVLALFFIMLFPAFYLYVRRDGSIPLIQSAAGDKSYVTLLNFKLNKYQNDRPVKHFEGTQAALIAVNMIEFTDHISGWRYSKSGKHEKEKFEASYARAHLDSHRLEDFQRPVKVTDAFFGKGVSVQHEDLAISTQEAHYLGSEKNILIGDKPVQATRKKQFIESENGFRINLNDETAELFGKVKGVVNPNGRN